MIWHLIRYLLSFSIPAYYKKIEAKNVGFLNHKGPIIIAMNHPNSFMDPICITWVTYPIHVRYLARGDAFKPGLAAYLLDQIGIVPIFRMRDGGKEGLEKNNESYRRVNTLLKNNEKIIIFAEGLCIQERRLRPLKKGVARMAFGAYEYLKDPDLIVIPVGVNYNNPSKFRSKLFYNIGAPLKVSDFIGTYKENAARGNNQFLQTLEIKMKELITHINNKENDVLVINLEKMVTKEWLKKLNLSDSLENEFTVTRHLTEIINNIDKHDIEKLQLLTEKTNAYFLSLKKNKLRDWLIDPLNIRKVTKQQLFLRAALIFILSPFYLLGYMAGYLPYKLTIFATKKLVKGNKEFYASIALGVGSFIFLFNFIIWFFVIKALSPNVLWPILMTSGLMACSWFSMNFHFFIEKTKGIKRIANNSTLYSQLSEKRREIMNIINGLTNFCD